MEKIYPHTLLYPPIRQIAPNQSLAIESVLSECNELLRNPIAPPFIKDDYPFLRYKTLHEIMDSIEGTHIRNGVPNCEACLAMYSTVALSVFLRMQNPSRYEQIQRSERITLLEIFEEQKDDLVHFILSALPTDEVKRQRLAEIDRMMTFLGWLSGKVGVPRSSNSAPKKPIVNGEKSIKKKRERGALTYKQAAKIAGVSEKQIERWKKEPPGGWPGLNDSTAFLKWATEQKNARIAKREAVQANHANRRSYTRRNEAYHPTDDTEVFENGG